jgi:hypothetical protein
MLSVISALIFLASIIILQEHNYAPLARAEGVCHADQVVPLGVAEVLRQQRSRAARWSPSQERLVQLEKNSIGQTCCPFITLDIVHISY